MRITVAFRVLLLLATTTATPLHAQAGIIRVLVRTDLGDIELAIDSAHAPATATNFLRYVDARAYAGGKFHRTVTMANQPTNQYKIEVVQLSAADSTKSYPPIALERTSETGLKHVDGTVSMARAAPNSATSDLFICIGDQPELDFGGRRNADGQGFAAFGRVTKGMNVVRRIHESPARGQTLTPPIGILGIDRVP
jgi:peptidyl-prolyl cis-trans isomerase A (cyclophilin A)